MGIFQSRYFLLDKLDDFGKLKLCYISSRHQLNRAFMMGSQQQVSGVLILIYTANAYFTEALGHCVRHKTSKWIFNYHVKQIQLKSKRHAN